jgi:hypothetical protein
MRTNKTCMNRDRLHTCIHSCASRQARRIYHPRYHMHIYARRTYMHTHKITAFARYAGGRRSIIIAEAMISLIVVTCEISCGNPRHERNPWVSNPGVGVQSWMYHWPVSCLTKGFIRCPTWVVSNQRLK